MPGEKEKSSVFQYEYRSLGNFGKYCVRSISGSNISRLLKRQHVHLLPEKSYIQEESQVIKWSTSLAIYEIISNPHHDFDPTMQKTSMWPHTKLGSRYLHSCPSIGSATHHQVSWQAYSVNSSISQTIQASATPRIAYWTAGLLLYKTTWKFSTLV
jgi:hypothetical protein